MYVIDKRNGRRPVCDRCHRVNVKIARGNVCESCRAIERHSLAKAEALLEFAREQRRRYRKAV